MEESLPPPVLTPSGAQTDPYPGRPGELSDRPITLDTLDLPAPEDLMDGTAASGASDPTYLASFWQSRQTNPSAPSAALAEQALQNVRGPLLALDPDLRVGFVNRAFCRAFRVLPSQIEGRWFPELGIGGRNVPRLRAFLDKVLAQEDQIERVEFEHDVPTIGARCLVIHGRRLNGVGVDDRLILLEMEDITEREATERHWRELIVTAVHELRNPLTSIKGHVQLMQKRNATSEGALSTILTQADQLSRLIDDLLASSGTGFAQPCLDPRRMDLVPLARTSAEQAQLLSPRHQIRLDVPESPIEGFWDGGRLAQVFANLLGNAVKYSPAGGEIVVRIRALDSTVRVSIEDHGKGIAADALPQIFDRFYRVAATASHVPGLGLGLHVCQALVEAHGGSISVRSVLGVGTTFAFELPRVAPLPAARSTRMPVAAM
jgi:two-component system CheB/CheR fusion protein